MIERQRRVNIDERVEPLVHPGVESLVRPDDHREPFVAQLVRGHAEQAALSRAQAAEHDHRVFHTAHGPRHVDRGRVGVAQPLFRVVLDRVAGVLGGARPVGVRLGWIERLDQDAVVAARVPDEGRGRGPGHVAHVLRGEAPRQRGARPGGAGRRLSHLRLRDDGDRRLRPDRTGETGAFGRREHLSGVLECTGRGHEKAARHRDGDVEVTVLEVELALAEVLLRVPAAHVVVDRHARVPLRDLVQPAAGELLPSHAVGSVLRHFEAIRQLELRLAPGRERPVEIGAQHGAVQCRGERDSSRCPPDASHGPDVIDRIPSLEAAAREARVGRIEKRPAARRLVDVLVELEPEIAQGVGGVVRIADRLRARDGVGRCVERRADGVVGPLLPIARPGGTGALADQRGRREGEPPEGRRIAHLGR